MSRFVIAIGAISSVLALLAAPGVAAARHHRYYHHTYSNRAYANGSDCEAERRHSANTGTVLGAVGGAVIGSQLAERGSRTTGTLLGAGGGALVGHQIGKSSHHCR